jgi:hypothetical protein
MDVCPECFIVQVESVLVWHRITEHDLPRPVGFVDPVSTGHLYVEEIVSIGAVGDSYGN